MAKIDIDKLNLDELKELAKDVQKRIVGYEAKKRNEALSAARSVAKEFGFSLEELTGAAPKKGKSKNPPKYAHPEKPEQTWSGRGRRPDWLSEALEQGKSLEDYAI